MHAKLEDESVAAGVPNKVIEIQTLAAQVYEQMKTNWTQSTCVYATSKCDWWQREMRSWRVVVQVYKYQLMLRAGPGH